MKWVLAEVNPGGARSDTVESRHDRGPRLRLDTHLRHERFSAANHPTVDRNGRPPNAPLQLALLGTVSSIQYSILRILSGRVAWAGN